MAVRQHLMALERKGIVTRSAKNNGVGRPIYVYSLTEKGTGIFPHAYVKFCLDILRLIEKDRGRDGVIELLKARSAESCDELLRVCPRHCTCTEKVSNFLEHKNSKGGMAEAKKVGDTHVIDIYNCIISEVAHRYPEVCKFELDAMKGVFGRGIKLEYHMFDGFAACRFTVPC